MTKKSPFFISCKKNKLLHPKTKRCQKYLSVEKMEDTLYIKCDKGYERNLKTKKCIERKKLIKSPPKSRNISYKWIGVGLGSIGLGLGLGLGLKK